MNKLTLIALATVAIASQASAVLLYDQAPHTPGASGGNGLSNFQGTLSGTLYDRQVADDFTVTGPGWIVDGVDITGIWFSAPFTKDPANGWDVLFLPKVGGAPSNAGSITATATSAVGNMTGQVYFSRDARKWLVNINPVNLSAGDWFVSIQPKNDENFFQLTSNPTTPIQGSPVYIRDQGTLGGTSGQYPLNWGPGSGIFGVDNDVAFSIHGQVVPEPGTMIALGAGLAALAARRRRK